MSSRHVAAVFLAVLGFGAAGTSIAACVGDDGVTPTTTSDAGGSEASPAPTGTTPATVLKANGATCGTGTECTNGQCIDGVCCESKCDGTCEKCNLPGTLGSCAAIPDATDPDNECPTVPLPSDDAGAPADAGDGDAATEAGAGGTDVDSGPAFNVPDGGLPPVTLAQCAGHCNGKRACAYADSTVTCGTAQFCGNGTHEGRATCDGAGHCLYGIQECSAYSCPDGSPGCKTSCTAPSDCLTGFYCDASSGTGVCKPRLANGTGCTSVTQCESNVCDAMGGVCCNTDCSSTPGGTCTKAGSVGQCSCSACATGPCGIFYRDADSDSYGDINGTIGNGNATYACAGSPPAGFVANKDDCFDGTSSVAASVHPGQTSFFTAGYTLPGTSTPTFDYDCSGSTEKETPEIPSCSFCVNDLFQVQSVPENSSGGVIIPPRFCSASSTCPSTGYQGTHQCSGCSAPNAPVFQIATTCGFSGTLYTCSKCTAAGGTASGVPDGTKIQACH